jgi:hypothetical protein
MAEMLGDYRTGPQLGVRLGNQTIRSRQPIGLLDVDYFGCFLAGCAGEIFEIEGAATRAEEVEHDSRLSGPKLLTALYPGTGRVNHETNVGAGGRLGTHAPARIDPTRRTRHMKPPLNPQAEKAIVDLARRYEVTPEAALAMLMAVHAGGGTMASSRFPSLADRASGCAGG